MTPARRDLESFIVSSTGFDVVNPQRIRIVLADDHPFILLALKQLIAAEPELELIGEATTGLQALSLVRSLTPDVAVIDVGMPEMNGIVLARKIRVERPTVKVLILTAYEDEAHLKQALAAGASGFVVKRSDRDAGSGHPRGHHRRDICRSFCLGTVGRTHAPDGRRGG